MSRQPNIDTFIKNRVENVVRQRHPGQLLNFEQGIDAGERQIIRQAFSDLGIQETPAWETIELGSLSETTPILSATAGGAAATTSGASTAAIVAGSIGAAVTAGGLLGGLIKATQEGTPSLTGHEYLGPFNDLSPSKTPISKTDAVAEVHDNEYQNTPIPIADSDRYAVEHFEEEFSNSGDPYAKVGSTLLNVKTGLEHFIGQQYPVKGEYHG